MLHFSETNVGVWKSFQSLSPEFGREGFLDAEKLDSLLEYAMTVPALKTPREAGGLGEDISSARDDLKCEARIFKTGLINTFDGVSIQDRPQATERLLNHCQDRPTMIMLTNIFKVAVVAGYSVASVESVFSARKRVHTSSRRRLTPYKQGNLTLLHFEKDYVRDISFPEFLHHFKNKKQRRLRL